MEEAMDERIKRLIAIGASVGANCHPCVEYHLGKALEMGIDKTEISEAVDMAKVVRKGAASSLDALVLKLLKEENANECGGDKKPSCCCS
jgi:AhpD family alkylhydroperoxidase